MANIGIIDYGMGNLGSVVNACRFLGLDAEILKSPADLDACRGLILPGQGAFGDCMANIDRNGYRAPLCEWAAADRPFLGICIGLQVLFESSEESPESVGLGLFRGSVRRFPATAGLKVPQMGWNRVFQSRPGVPCLEGIADGAHFYFVHSYYVDTPDAEFIAGETEYGFRYTSCVARGRLFACQFHPEKSQADGLTLLKNFGAICRAEGEG
jgi:imidazole glycerol-phosphate synthase subunit HisH